MLFSNFKNNIHRLDYINRQLEELAKRRTEISKAILEKPPTLAQHLEMRKIYETESQLKTEKNQLILDERSRKVAKKLKHNPVNHLERLIIGDGVSGTMVYDQLPIQYRSNEVNGMPSVLAIADPINSQQWDKHNLALMGQQETVQCPVSFTHKPSEFSRALRNPNIELISNPFRYTRGADFTSALRATQVDLGMHTLSVTLKKVEKREDTPDWDANSTSFPYRCTIDMDGNEKLIYTNHIDICSGFGVTRKLQENNYIHRHTKLEKEKQIDPALSKKLIQTGALIYANDNGSPELNGDVVVFGGSAMSGAIVADILYKKDDGVRLVKWVSGSTKDLNDTRDTNRMNKKILDEDLEENLSLLIMGDISKVEEYNGKIKVTFDPVNKLAEETGPIAEKIDRPNAEYSLICDHLVVGIGSDNKLSKLFEKIPFKPLYSSSVKGQDKIHVGTRSVDGYIVAWGAAGRSGFGLNNAAWSAYTQQRDKGNLSEYVKTLPPESRGFGTILSSERAILTAAKTLRKKQKLPNFDRGKNLKNINNVSILELSNKLKKILLNTSFKNQALDITQNVLLSQFAQDLALRIIELRKKSPVGLSLDQLKTLNLPNDMIDEMSKAYYPFCSEKRVKGSLRLA
jgi:hypothetical protein